MDKHHHVIQTLKDHGHDHLVVGGRIHAIHPHHGQPVPVHTARKLAAFLNKHGNHKEGGTVHGEHSSPRLDRKSRGEKVPEHHLFGGPVSPQERAAIAIKRRAMPMQAAPQAAALAARPAIPPQAIGQRPFKHGGKARHAHG